MFDSFECAENDNNMRLLYLLYYYEGILHFYNALIDHTSAPVEQFLEQITQIQESLHSPDGALRDIFDISQNKNGQLQEKTSDEMETIKRNAMAELMNIRKYISKMFPAVDDPLEQLRLRSHKQPTFNDTNVS